MISRVFLSVTDRDLVERFGGTFGSIAEVEVALLARIDDCCQGDICYLAVVWREQCNFELGSGVLAALGRSNVALAITTDEDD